MTDETIFDLAPDIQFDQPGKSKKDIANVRKALTDAIALKQTALNNENSQAGRDKLNAQITALKDAQTDLFTGEALSDLFYSLCKARTEQAKKSFIASILLLSNQGKKTISKKAVRERCRAEKLNYDKTVTPMFSGSGELAFVKLGEISIDADYPKFPANAEKTFEMLKTFRSLGKDALKGNPPTADVMDLYDLAAYFMKGFTSVYHNQPVPTRKSSASDFFKLFDAFSKYFQLASADAFITYCRNLSSTAKTDVFRNDSARDNYDTFLLYKNPKLQQQFELIHSLSNQMRCDNSIVDASIKVIREFFPNVKTAYAIYSKESGISVEPPSFSFTILCSYCHTINDFSSESEAQDAVCVSCRKPLYKVCPSCKKKSPKDSKRCTNPACGVFFADEQEYEKEMQLALAALNSGKSDEARQHLARAMAANPGEKVRTGKLDADIKSFENRYKLPLDQINQLVLARKFKEAKAFAATLPAKYPGINIAGQIKIINEALSRCDSLYAASKIQDPITRANTMIDILDIASDYSAADEYLKGAKPSACQGLWADSVVETGSVELGWNAPRERGVLFRVLRKDGTTPSQNPQDGSVILDKSNDISFIDKNVILGSEYTYTVFSVRRDVYSTGVSVKAVALKCVSDISYTQDNDKIRLVWAKPVGIPSVTVFREMNGAKTVLSRNAVSSIEDKIPYGVQAIYHIMPNCPAFPEKAEARFEVRITQKIERFSISASLKNKTTAEVRWDLKIDGISIKIFVNGKEIKTIQSDPGACTIPIPGTGVFKISAQALSGGTWIDSTSSVSVSQLAAPECDASIEEKISGKVIVSVQPSGPLPRGVNRIEAFIRKKENPESRVPWVTTEDAPSCTPDIIIPVEGNAPGTKEIHARTEDRYYVSIFAVYKEGNKELYSEPVRKPLSRPLVATISFEIKKGWFSRRTLTITTKSNRFLTVRPALKLCSGIKGKGLQRYDHPDATLVLDIPEKILEGSTTTLTETFDLPSSVQKGVPVFLFPTEKEKNASITFPWSDGFRGLMP